MASKCGDFSQDFNSDFGPPCFVPPPPGPAGPGGPQFFNPGAEWQLIDRLAEPKPPMSEIPW